MTVTTLIFILCMFVLVVWLLRYLFGSSTTLKGQKDAKTLSTMVVPVNAVPSNNYTYSTWIYVNDWNYRYGEQKMVFARMDNANPCPAVSLGETENNLNIAISYYPYSGVTVPNVYNASVWDIPIQKWFNFIMSVNGRSLDVYIDGKLTRSFLLPGIAYINQSSPIELTPNGGYDGWISNFEYLTNPVNPQEAYNIYAKGSSWSSFFNSYHLQFSILQNGNTESSITL